MAGVAGGGGQIGPGSGRQGLIGRAPDADPPQRGQRARQPQARRPRGGVRQAGVVPRPAAPLGPFKALGTPGTPALPSAVTDGGRSSG